MTRWLMASVVLLASVPVWAQEPKDDVQPQKEMDAFDRQVVVARIEYVGVNRTVIDIEGTRAVYPNGTLLNLTLQYIQGETSEAQPYGDPEAAKKDGSTKRLAATDAIVRDWRYSARFTFDRYLPPGEYAISAFFRLDVQTRALRHEYVSEYVPVAERKNPCQFCRYHYGMTKVAVTDPTYVFGDPALQSQAGKPMWWRQKQDYQRRMLGTYADWYAQIVGASEALASAELRVLGFGPTEMLAIDRLTSALPEEVREEQTAIQGWHAIAAGLARCRAELAGHPDLPGDPQRYWRLRVFGEGRMAGENLSNPVPAADSTDRPWAFDYARPRLALVAAEMARHHREVACDVAPHVVVDLRTLRERVDATVDIANRRIDGVIETIEGQHLEALASAPPELKARLSQKLVAAYREVVMAAERAKFLTRRVIEADMRRLEAALGIAVAMPVVTWPVPGAITQPPQNSQEELEKLLDGLFGKGVRDEANEAQRKKEQKKK